LSLAYALAVFAAGSVVVAGLYLWQVRRLSEPIIIEPAQVVVIDPRTGQRTDTAIGVLSRSRLAAAYLEDVERRAYRYSLEELRKASLVALPVLAVVAFGSGWVLSGWTLQPMRRMVVVARDISERDLSGRIGLRGPDDELKDLADTFDEMLDRLQASFEDQRRFVQDMSHEIRNPLAIASANLELALDGRDPDEVRRVAGIAHRAIGRVNDIVDDLVRRARQGVPSSTRGPVDLRDLVGDVAIEQAVRAQARSITLAQRVEAGRAPVVTGDASALRRAVTNLVVNALRLAPEGSTVTVGAGLSGEWATLSVTDEGPGIRSEDQLLVFDRFWRGADAGKGLGLGLSIVRQVAERHGGRVDLMSTPGVGSTFTIRLPMPIERRDVVESSPGGGPSDQVDPVS
jgi:signal transduction histidine kinase